MEVDFLKDGAKSLVLHYRIFENLCLSWVVEG
jgi:hypothetical protein